MSFRDLLKSYINPDPNFRITPEYLQNERAKRTPDAYAKWLRVIHSRLKEHCDSLEEHGMTIPEEFQSGISLVEGEMKREGLLQ